MNDARMNEKQWENFCKDISRMSLIANNECDTTKRVTTFPNRMKYQEISAFFDCTC